MSRVSGYKKLSDNFKKRKTNRESREIFWHALRTGKSLLRFPKKGTPNPRYITQFSDVNAFIDWSIRNGCSTNKELELSEPQVLENTKLEYKWVQLWKDNKVSYERMLEPIFRDEPIPERYWVTDYKCTWVEMSTLQRRKNKPRLTAYGAKRYQIQKKLKKLKKVKKIRAFGEAKSARAWANDSRCTVSDKTIKSRLNAGWKPKDAIITPPWLHYSEKPSSLIIDS
jgi:hypothetical protein